MARRYGSVRLLSRRAADRHIDELMAARNDTGEVWAWVTIAGAMRGRTAIVLSYEPIYELINGMPS